MIASTLAQIPLALTVPSPSSLVRKRSSSPITGVDTYFVTSPVMDGVKSGIQSRLGLILYLKNWSSMKFLLWYIFLSDALRICSFNNDLYMYATRYLFWQISIYWSQHFLYNSSLRSYCQTTLYVENPQT